MRKLLLVSLLLMGSLAYSQDPGDVLRLSQTFNNGTARFVSMGGAFGALGADFTSLSYNPAGLGVYRSSEFIITPSLKIRNDNTNYLSSSFTDKRTRVLLDNIGFVASMQNSNEEGSGLVMLNFGIGYNRILDLYSETSAIGANASNSIMDYFAWVANGSLYDGMTIRDNNDPFKVSNAPWDAILAWNNFLIDTIPGQASEYWAALNENDGVNQDQAISTKGGVGEYVFSMAANISNKFYLGATLGLQDVFFTQNTYYSESAFSSNQPLPNGDRFNSLNYNQRLSVNGYGINLKIGAIYRPIPELRLGIAAHTPTYYMLNEEYDASMNSDFLFGTSSANTPINTYGYRIESPYKFIGSVAYTFGTKGLLSVDYEHVDYSSMRFGKGDDGYRFTEENSTISESFKSTFNIKAGGEIWFDRLALRAGYALYGSPYNPDTDYASSSTNVFSGGFGLRFDSMYLDWAYQRVVFSDKYSPYQFAPIVNRDVVQNRFMLTVGFKF